MLFIESVILSSLFTESIVYSEGRRDELLHGGVGHVGVHPRLALVALEAVAHEAEEVELVKVLVVTDKGRPALAPTRVLVRVSARANLARLRTPVPDISSFKLWPQFPDTIRSTTECLSSS